MGIGLSAYRLLTRAAGAVLAPLAARSGSSEGVWRSGFRGATGETDRAAGAIWVHAASLGEVGAARPWVEGLLLAGCRPPVLLTTRTRAGLDRARGSLGERAAARIAPHDLPQVVGAVLDAAGPWRLDIIETELWPNLILEARRRSVAVVFVGATVSRTTAAWLGGLGAAGPALLGDGVFVLAQSKRHAERFAMLGCPRAHIEVIGDLKAEAPARPAVGPAARGRGTGDSWGEALTLGPFASRPAVLFGSLRPGEERVARLLAEAIEGHRARFGRARAAWAARQGTEDPFAGRSRAILVIAPRHRAAEERVKAAFRRDGFEVLVRDEGSRGDRDVGSWIDEAASLAGRRIGLLATRGELEHAYDHAWAAVVGGTFAPRGGHNVWEPAARACPVIVGPHHDEVTTAVEAVCAAGGGVVASNEHHLLSIFEGWLQDHDLERRGLSALRARVEAAGAARRGIEALSRWGLGL